MGEGFPFVVSGCLNEDCASLLSHPSPLAPTIAPKATRKIQGLGSHRDTARLCVERQRGNHEPFSLFHRSFLVSELTVQQLFHLEGRLGTGFCCDFARGSVRSCLALGAPWDAASRSSGRHGGNWNHAPPQGAALSGMPRAPPPPALFVLVLSLCHDFSNWIQICSFYDKNHKNMISNLLRWMCLPLCYL